VGGGGFGGGKELAPLVIMIGFVMIANLDINF
jgi:hypothetical protein